MGRFFLKKSKDGAEEEETKNKPDWIMERTKCLNHAMINPFGYFFEYKRDVVSRIKKKGKGKISKTEHRNQLYKHPVVKKHEN